MEQVHTVKSYRQIYLEYKKDPSDKAFFEEHKSKITFYENALSDLKKSYSKLPNAKDILKELDSLHEKKNTLMQEYSSSKSDMKELYQIRKNYEKYMGKEMKGSSILLKLHSSWYISIYVSQKLLSHLP